MIDVQSLTKLYGDFPAVRDLAFAVQPGEVLGLVGPNGAGKTTTLRCLAGIIAPTSGTVAAAGHEPRTPAPAAQPAPARARREARARLHPRRAASLRLSHGRRASTLHRSSLRRRRRRV